MNKTQKVDILKKYPGQKISTDCQTQLIVLYSIKTQVNGKLLITNYRLCFYNQDIIFIDIPHGFILKSQRTLQQNNVSYVELTLKFGIIIKFKYTDVKFQNSIQVNDLISKLIQTASMYVSQISKEFQQGQLCGKWVSKEIGQIKQCQKFDNEDWKIFPAYPQHFIVPTPYIGKRDPNFRLLVLVHVNEGKYKTALWRNGPGKPDKLEEQWVPKAKSLENRHYVLQIKNKAINNKSQASKCVDLDTLVSLKESISKVFISSIQSDPQKWISQINASRWFDQLGIIMKEASLIVKNLTQNYQVSVLSDWQVRSAQVCSLAMIILQPSFRTFKGFSRLVQKQFLQFGNNKTTKKQKEEEKGLAIIQFLDAVFQLTCIFPLSFQFNNLYLSFIASNIYSNQFGNFLYVTKAITQNNRRDIAKYSSIWNHLQKNYHKYRNGYYLDYKNCDMYELKEFISIKSFKLWDSFFLRLFNHNGEEDIVERHQVLNIQHYKLRKSTDELRKIINSEHIQIIEKTKKLKQLKQLEFQ